MQSVSSRVPANLELWSCAGANGDRAVARIARHQRSNAQDILGHHCWTPLVCAELQGHTLLIFTPL